MATKTQREFKKQMKQLEKEGKLPVAYYGQRRKVVFGTSISGVILVLFILWQTGILHMILGSLIFGIASFFGAGSELHQELPDPQMSQQLQAASENNQFITELAKTYNIDLNSDSFNMETESQYFFEYCDKAQLADTFISKVYIDLYNHFYNNTNVSLETFQGYNEQVEDIISNIDTDKSYLSDLYENLESNLKISIDMINFSINYYAKELTTDDKYYVENLAAQSKKLLKRREAIIGDLNILFG